jgi:hypothetical protein
MKLLRALAISSSAKTIPIRGGKKAYIKSVHIYIACVCVLVNMSLGELSFSVISSHRVTLLCGIPYI